MLLCTKTCIWAMLTPMSWCYSVHLSNADTYALMLLSTKTCIWAMLTPMPWCYSVHLSNADTYALMLLSTKTCIWAMLTPMPWCYSVHLSNADTYALMLLSTKTCIWAMLTPMPWCYSVHLSNADTYALMLLSTKTCIWAMLTPMPWCCSVQRLAFEQCWYLCLHVAQYKDLHLSNADTYVLMLLSTSEQCWHLCLDVAQYIWAMLTPMPWCYSVHLSKADTYALMLLSTKICIWAKLIPMPWCCSVQRLAFEQCWYLCLHVAQYKDLHLSNADTYVLMLLSTSEQCWHLCLDVAQYIWAMLTPMPWCYSVHLSKADTYALMLLSTKICIWAKLIPMPWCCSVQRLAFEQCWHLCLHVAQYKDLHLCNADTYAFMLLSTKTCICAMLTPMSWCYSVQRLAFEQCWYLCLDVAQYKDLHLSNADTCAFMLLCTKTCIWAMMTPLPWCCLVQRLAFEQCRHLCLDIAQYKDLHLWPPWTSEHVHWLSITSTWLEAMHVIIYW